MDYTSVRVTEGLSELIESADDVAASDVRDWKASGDRSTIPFSLLHNLHKHMTLEAKPSAKKYLHELLEGSELVLPNAAKELQPRRSAEFEAHLAHVRAQAEQKAYNRMVRNVDPAANQMERFKLGLEIQSVSRQMWAMVNFLLTVIGAFVFGYCAAYYAGYAMPTCVFIGLTLAILVFLADLYFLVRTPQEKPKNKKKTN